MKCCRDYNENMCVFEFQHHNRDLCLKWDACCKEDLSKSVTSKDVALDLLYDVLHNYKENFEIIGLAALSVVFLTCGLCASCIRASDD